MKYYTKDHEWVDVEGNEAVIGISEHAASELGDITYVELPPVDENIATGDSVGVVESVKAASDVYTPVGGVITAINEELEDDPALINSSAEDNGWICKLSNVDVKELDHLMDKEAYATYLEELS